MKKKIIISILIIIFLYIIFCLGVTGSMGRKIKFFTIYNLDLWRTYSSQSTSSGKGSELKNTKVILKLIPLIVKKYNINTILDCGCGDMNWMKLVLKNPTMKHIKYLGIDLVMANTNKKLFPQYDFKKLDIVTNKLPNYDLAIAKDVFIHLSNNEIKKTIKNMKKSGIKYLLCDVNKASTNNDLVAHYRTINLSISPFNLNSIEYFETDGNDKSYNLYKL